MKNELLAITIPTYNRAEILEENLLLMLPEIIKYSIPIYISDDSTNDATAFMISRIQKQYEFIYYYKNNPGLGHDKNVFRALQLTHESYAWLLGDAMQITKNGIANTLDCIAKQNVDFIGVNVPGRVIDYRLGVHSDPCGILLGIGWHLTMTGVTIYSRSAINESVNVNLGKFKNFPQMALIFHVLAHEKASFYWSGEQLVASNSKKESYWLKNIFSVFVDDWINLIRNLPEVYSEVKNDAFVLHAKHTRLFSAKNLIYLRHKGILTIESIKKNTSNLKIASGQSILFMYLIALVPKIAINLALKIGKIIQPKSNK